ncbi:hypothetical protein HOE04_04955 [archaeon]|jgi:hypothetical protein|nr:hypothetical protein [archaeon]
MELDIGGGAYLTKNNTSSTQINYFLVLGNGRRGPYVSPVHSNKLNVAVTPPSEIKIPITKEEYDSLEKQLDESSAKEAILSMKGKLEVKVSAVCLN